MRNLEHNARWRRAKICYKCRVPTLISKRLRVLARFQRVGALVAQRLDLDHDVSATKEHACFVFVSRRSDLIGKGNCVRGSFCPRRFWLSHDATCFHERNAHDSRVGKSPPVWRPRGNLECVCVCVCHAVAPLLVFLSNQQQICA